MTETWWILLEAAARAAFLGLAVGLSLWLWRRRSPSARHAVWVAVVLGMLALPLLTALGPRWTLAVPTLAETAAPGAATVLQAADSRLPAAAAALPRLGTTDGQTFHEAPGPGAPGRFEDLSWNGLLALIYFGVAVLMLLSLARGGVQLRRLSRAARPVEDAALRALAHELLPERAVAISSSPAVRVPLTAGFRRPQVFLPDDWRDWSEEKRRAVLAHELSHVRRGDFLWTLLAELNKCLYWFHPLAWIARRRLAAAAEQASDATAVARLGSHTAYARVLVEMAARLAKQQGRVTGALAAVPMASSSDLSRRVEEILSSSGDAAPRRRAAVAGAASALLVALAGTVDLVAQPDEPERPASLEVPVGALIAELGDADPDRRARAAYELALDESYWDSAVPHLVALLADDAEISGRPPRRRSLRRGDRWTPSYVTWERPSPGEVAVVSLASMSSRATEPLIEALAHGDPVVRRNAAWGLGELRNRPGIPEHGESALIGALGDTDPSVRAAAAWSLGDIRVRRAIPELIDALRDDPESRVRAMAAHALGEIRAATAEDLLATVASEDPDQGVRREARRALGEVIEHGF